MTVVPVVDEKPSSVVDAVAQSAVVVVVVDAEQAPGQVVVVDDVAPSAVAELVLR